jgi:hypothetical protein
MMRSSFLLAAAASLAGCAGGGALGQGTLFRECHAGDPACKSIAPAAPLAVGAHLRPAVEIEIAGTATPTVGIVSGEPDVLAAEDGVLRAVRPGVAPVLITADDGTVIDFVHVWVAAPTRIAVEEQTGRADTPEEVARPIQLVAGESRWLSPAIYGGAQRLAGAADVTWTADCGGAPCTSVALLEDGALGRRRLVARSPGKARIALDGLGQHASIDVEVVP